jgi:hypothetical protein
MEELGAVEWLIDEWLHLDADFDMVLIDRKTYWDKLKEVQRQAKEMEQEQRKVTENTSDGYHTFKELYEFRKAYNVALFNEWASQIKTDKTFCMATNGKIIEVTTDTTYKYDVHKSWKHNDGELCFGGGWFIVVAILPEGQISNHYKEEDWDLFKIPEVEKAKYAFDGHNSNDVINRLINI